VNRTPRPNVIKLFTAVIYCHSMVFTLIIMFYNTEWWYDHGMAVNYRCKKFYNIGPRSHIHNTSFSSEPMNELNKLKCLITLCRKGLPGANTLAYWAYSSVTRKKMCCEFSLRVSISKMFPSFRLSDKPQWLNYWWGGVMSTATMPTVANVAFLWIEPECRSTLMPRCTLIPP